MTISLGRTCSRFIALTERPDLTGLLIWVLKVSQSLRGLIRRNCSNENNSSTLFCLRGVLDSLYRLKVNLEGLTVECL